MVIFCEFTGPKTVGTVRPILLFFGCGSECLKLVVGPSANSEFDQRFHFLPQEYLSAIQNRVRNAPIKCFQWRRVRGRGEWSKKGCKSSGVGIERSQMRVHSAEWQYIHPYLSFSQKGPSRNWPVQIHRTAYPAHGPISPAAYSNVYM